jgi:FAD dependent oxidoreductase
MTEDPFLLRHLVSSLRFSISGNLAPISIRDQMLRAKMFVDRACEVGLIGREYPLLVVGAGAAGASAAYYAATEKQVPTTLIERGEKPFRLQSQCESRWICPTQYDWPAGHWTRATYPCIDVADIDGQVPIPWSAEMANFVAAGWRRIFDTADPARLRFLTCMRYMSKNSPIVGDVVKVRYREFDPEELRMRLTDSEAKALGERYDQEALRGDRKMFEEFGAVLEARGFAAENVQLGHYRGLAFWETDPFAERNLGRGPGPIRVLICGDGDGALQDFLRITTGKHSAAAIMEKIEPLLDRKLLREIYSEEDHAFRAKSWNLRMHDHKVQCRLDRMHREWAQEIVGSGAANQVRSVLDGLLNYSRGVQLDLIHRCEHFTALYPLNRFLVYLIAAMAPSSIRIFPRVSVREVSCQHPGPRGPRTCLGQDHSVEIEAFAHCNDRAGARAADEMPRIYDTVILRLGLERVLVGEQFQFRFPRELLPYHPV